MVDPISSACTHDEPSSDLGDADIKISAHGDRRVLEAVYLELRELAARNRLKIEYRLTVQKPEDQPSS
ncbi:MAG: hypothetical protein K2Y71_20045 [Xanthobacteraceae bacterium]|nr:hypothetical protein [Xanthobacteraceae bacterium]